MSEQPKRGTNQKEALYEAALAAVEDAQRRPGRSPRGSGRGVRVAWGLAAAAALFAGYLLIARPAWFLTPPPASESPQIQEASIRLMLVREAGRIRTLTEQTGRAPTDRAGTGTALTDLRYERLSDTTFLLALPFGTGEIVFRSTDSVATFLGSSLTTITDRTRP